MARNKSLSIHRGVRTEFLLQTGTFSVVALIPQLIPVKLNHSHRCFPRRRSTRRLLVAANETKNNFYREKLQLEIAARERAEKKYQEFEERLKAMTEDLAKREQDLQNAEDKIRALEEQVKLQQQAREELEARQNELQACRNISNAFKRICMRGNILILILYILFRK